MSSRGNLSLAGFKNFKVGSVCEALQSGEPWSQARIPQCDTARFLKRENPFNPRLDKDQFSPTPKLPDDKTFIKPWDTMASARPLWGRQWSRRLVGPWSARTGGEPMGEEELGKWLLQEKAPTLVPPCFHKRQLGWSGGRWAVGEKAVWWSANSSQIGARGRRQKVPSRSKWQNCIFRCNGIFLTTNPITFSKSQICQKSAMIFFGLDQTPSPLFPVLYFFQQKNILNTKIFNEVFWILKMLIYS